MAEVRARVVWEVTTIGSKSFLVEADGVEDALRLVREKQERDEIIGSYWRAVASVKRVRGELVTPRPSSPSDLIALLNRAAAALETPNDLTPEEVEHVIEDLVVEAKKLGDATEGPSSRRERPLRQV
jgi:hypothetical protein